MATAAQHRAEIDRINGEVSAQAAKIAQLRSEVETLPDAGGSEQAEEYANLLKAAISYNLTEYVDTVGVTTIASYGFYYQTKLKRVVFPSLTTAGAYAFRRCTSLEYADFSVLKSFGEACFYDDSKLATLILRKTDGITTMGNANALNNTMIDKGTGYVYVPSALIESYKANERWSKHADQIRAIEEYPEITGG